MSDSSWQLIPRYIRLNDKDEIESWSVGIANSHDGQQRMRLKL